MWKANKAMEEIFQEIKLRKYIDGLVLIARIGVHAEILNHHPDLYFSPSRLKITLTTKSAGGLTDLDTVMAERIENFI